jgi:hypothetical protein
LPANTIDIMMFGGMAALIIKPANHTKIKSPMPHGKYHQRMLKLL